jgi:acylphosphatase
MACNRYIVRGRVQGVGFRFFVQDEAQKLGVTGWVRNNPDGAVEVLASGSAAQLAALHGRLRSGPRSARVDDVDVTPADAPKNLKTFRIEGAW